MTVLLEALSWLSLLLWSATVLALFYVLFDGVDEGRVEG